MPIVSIVAYKYYIELVKSKKGTTMETIGKP